MRKAESGLKLHLALGWSVAQHRTLLKPCLSYEFVINSFRRISDIKNGTSLEDLADPHDVRAADGANAMGAHELRAARAHAPVAAGNEHVRVATVEADNALTHTPPLGRKM